MPSIPSGVIIMWPGTVASIPSGWTRVTDLDSRHIKGTADAVNPNVTGGAATHGHTASSHTHSTAGTHTHTAVSPTGEGNQQVNMFDGTASSRREHTHTLTATSGSGSGTLFGSQTPTWQVANSDPAYFEVIYIQSDGSPNGFPNTCLTFWNTTTAPNGWTQHAASVSRFMKGAAAAGNGGGTGGGAHVHVGNAHTHDIAQHTHTMGQTTGGPSLLEGASGSDSIPSPTHTHTAYDQTSGASGSSGSTASADATSTTYEPEFYTLWAIENTSGANSWKKDQIVMWLGTLAAIPTSWLLCDGTSGTPDLRGKFIKTAASGGAVGGTGGTAGHSHTSPATHTHTGINHSHSKSPGTSNTPGSPVAQISGTPEPANSRIHQHDVTLNSSTTGDSSGTAQDVSSTADTQPAFRTVAYLMSPAGLNLGNMFGMF